jgi:hypothetical protein
MTSYQLSEEAQEFLKVLSERFGSSPSQVLDAIILQIKQEDDDDRRMARAAR